MHGGSFGILIHCEMAKLVVFCRSRPSDSITALFAAAGLPVEAIILLSPISSIADMARTATNVVGAAAATTLVAATEGQLDKAVYNGKVEAPAAEAV